MIGEQAIELEIFSQSIYTPRVVGSAKLNVTMVTIIGRS
jgi:hypothetical protein